MLKVGGRVQEQVDAGREIQQLGYQGSYVGGSHNPTGAILLSPVPVNNIVTNW